MTYPSASLRRHLPTLLFALLLLAACQTIPGPPAATDALFADSLFYFYNHLNYTQ